MFVCSRRTISTDCTQTYRYSLTGNHTEFSMLHETSLGLPPSSPPPNV